MSEKTKGVDDWICGACRATNAYDAISCHMCHKKKGNQIGRICEHCGHTAYGYYLSNTGWHWHCQRCSSQQVSRHVCYLPDGEEVGEDTYFRKGTDGKVEKVLEGCWLHLGCGRRNLPGYTSVDIRPEVEPDVVADIETLEEFEDGVADIIYAAHLLEHIPRPHILTVLEEWRRVLKPGGTLRLSVPDFYELANLYMYHDVSMWRITGPLHGRQDYEANTHFISFDYEYLAWMLGTAGYHDIRRWNPDIMHPLGYDDISRARIENRHISLNVEATA